MARIITFIGMCVGILLVLNLKSFHDLPVNNAAFNYDEAQKNYTEKMAMLHELTKAHEEEKPEEVEEKPQGPVVVLDTEELKRGSELFQKCLICHGKLGEGKASQKAPRIGGQHDWYIELQIKNMRDGNRVNAVMMPYVRNLSDQDIADLSVYISKLPW